MLRSPKPWCLINTNEKPSMNRDAPRWFYNVWAYNAKVIEYLNNFVKENSNTES
jgi:hypothetical protein